jgi:Transposase DDE domain
MPASALSKLAKWAGTLWVPRQPCFDDSTQHKRYAQALEGLGRHYSGVEKKVVNGHSLVQALSIVENQQMPLTPQMYQNRAACQAQENAFQSKVEMVYEEKQLYVHRLTTWIRGLGPVQLLIVKCKADAGVDKMHFFITSRLDDSLTQFVATIALRWKIEILFADLKELMGSDHYQARSATAILRFWALALCLYQFLDQIRHTHGLTTGQHLSLGQARHLIRNANTAITIDWFYDKILSGASRDEIHLALKPAMLL